MGLNASVKSRDFKKGPGQKMSRASAFVGDSVPDKVYIEKKPEYEYSLQEPGGKYRLEKLLDGYYGQSNFIELFHCLPEIFAPVHEIASRVASARWELRKEWNDEADYKDTNFNKLFTSPNPFMSMQQHVYWSVCYYLLTGRVFWHAFTPSLLEKKKYANIVSWFTLPSQYLWANQKKTDIYTCNNLSDYITNYRLHDLVTGNTQRTFETDEVMPLVSMSLKSGYDFNKNNSPLLGADKAIKNLIPVYETRGTIFIKRGAMGFIVSRKTDDSGSVALTKTETDALQTDYHNTYGTTGGKHNIGITGQPIDFISIGMTIKEMQPFEETLADAVAIYSTLRVPRHLVPAKDQGTFSNVDISMKGFYSDVIQPLADMFAEIWTIGMGFPEYRKYIKASFQHIDILQENKKEKAEVDKVVTEVAIKRYEAGIITKNERNALVDVQPVENGDTYISDEKNKDPLILQLGTEGINAMQSVLSSTTMTDDAKLIALINLFGIPNKVAKKLIQSNEIDTNEQNDITDQDN